MPAAKAIEISPLEIGRLSLTLIGDTPLICHRWSEKAKKQIKDKQAKKARQAKEARDPEAEYQASLYPMPGGKGYGFPSVAFKNAAVRAANDAGMKMTEARRAFHVAGEYVAIDGEPSMREDMVRIGAGVADIRYRGQFETWRVTLRVSFNSRVISAEQVVNLFNLAGFGVGVGEWRPERNGPFGMFHIADESEVAA